MKAISLFSGVGGMDLGLERAGIETVLQAESDPYCLQVLEKHWPDVRRVDDVRSVGGWVRDELGDIDLVYGGDPCQENSNARRSADTISPSLGSHFVRIVDELRPRLVLRENPSRVRSDAPWPWWRFRSELERMGYAVLPFRLRACCVGADHQRERLFLLGELQDTNSTGLEGNVRQEVAGAYDGGYHTDAAGPDRWSAAPRVCGRGDGVPHRVDRLRALGNAVVPQVAQWIGERLIDLHQPPEPSTPSTGRVEGSVRA